jgi:hypothetical protein
MSNRVRSAIAISLITGLAQADAVRRSPAAEAAVIERTRAIVADYGRTLPNFTCVETIRRFMRYTTPAWQSLDILTVRTRYAAQSEDRIVIRRNGFGANDAERELTGMSNTGELGGMLVQLFDPNAEAAFHWESDQKAGERPVAVYSYQVRKAHSAYALGFNPGGRHQIVAYRGTVVIDRETGGVLRMSYETDSIPADFPIQYAKTQIDYDYVKIRGKSYLMPFRSQVETGNDSVAARNISEFAGYKPLR